jgi:phage baseplate assembly protein W
VKPINWSPTPLEEVLQNVETLLRTAPGSVPLARALGTPQDVLDTPMSAAAARLQRDVIRAVRAYEPRAKVRRVRLEVERDGRLRATAELVAP